GRARRGAGVAGARVAGAGLTRRARDTAAVAVADLAGPIARSPRPVAEVHADRRAGLAADDARLARSRVRRAVRVGRAGVAAAVAVAAHAGAACGDVFL